ncbi:MAG: CRTAC1 family protein [Planctomycetota bacterium]|nr:CRTAC1 family protein [Planctomycetota bacterium]
MRTIQLSLVFLLLLGCNPGGNDIPQNATQKSKQDQRLSIGAPKVIPKKQQRPTNQPIDFAFVWKKNSGIDFKHGSGFDDQRVFPAANGSGIGILDFDLDSLADAYFASGKHFPVGKPTQDSLNQLYRNLGNWEFDNGSVESSTAIDAYCSGVTIGDFDNDGFQDIYVGCYGPNLLIQNMGDGSFAVAQGKGMPHGKPVRAENFDSAIPDTPGWATSCAFFDYNNDGNLDIYVGNYGVWNLQLKNNCGSPAKGEPRFCSPTSVRPQSDVLYESNGDGTFKDVSEKSGIYTYVQGKSNSAVREDYRTQGVVVTDFNGDGLSDIYCGNDMDANLLLINTKDFKFENHTELSSTGYGPNGNSLASMGVAAADANNDGLIDLFCTNFSAEYNSFYKGLGDLQFAEVSKQNRLGDGAKPWVGWGTEFIDLDCDGWLDVIVTNGHVDPNIDQFEPGQEHLQPCLIWKNVRGRFRLARVEGEYFEMKHPGRALALADFDNDGDLDLVVGHQDQAPGLLENRCQTAPQGTNLSLKLIGTQSNRDGIGARLDFQGSGNKLGRILMGGGSYLSSHSKFLHETRLNDSSAPAIVWPSGATGNLDFNPEIPIQSVIVVEPSP